MGSINAHLPQSDESGTEGDESGNSGDESAQGWDESAARGATNPCPHLTPRLACRTPPISGEFPER